MFTPPLLDYFIEYKYNLRFVHITNDNPKQWRGWCRCLRDDDLKLSTVGLYLAIGCPQKEFVYKNDDFTRFDRFLNQKPSSIVFEELGKSETTHQMSDWQIAQRLHVYSHGSLRIESLNIETCPAEIISCGTYAGLSCRFRGYRLRWWT